MKDNDISSVKEYRCNCGKLLFKGSQVFSFVEIKCRRCGVLNTFGNLFKKQDSIIFCISIDRNGYVTDICTTAELLLGYKKSQIIGNSILDFSPLIYERVISNLSPNYEIKNNTFLIHGGGKIMADSYCISSERHDELSGYYIFSLI